jgi:hypothetical protein
MGNQVTAQAATYTTHKKHRRRTSIHSVGLEPAIPANKQLQTYALDHMAIGISCLEHCLYKMEHHILLVTYYNFEVFSYVKHTHNG